MLGKGEVLAALWMDLEKVCCGRLFGSLTLLGLPPLVIRPCLLVTECREDELMALLAWQGSDCFLSVVFWSLGA